MKKKIIGEIILISATVFLVGALLLRGRIDYTPISNIVKHEKKTYHHSDTLKALIFYHAADYFVYHGQVIGFQYDMIKQIAKDFNMKVDIAIEADPDSMLMKSFTNKYDIVSFDFNKSFFSPMYLTQSEPHSYTYPILLMRKNMVFDSSATHVAHTPAQYFQKLDFSSLQMPKTWRQEDHPDKTVEDLIEMLEDTLIDYVVCNHYIAITLLPFYHNLVMGPRIGEDFPRNWILNPKNKTLNDSINLWLSNVKPTKFYKKMTLRYLSQHSQVINNSFGKKKDNISTYDNCIQAASKRHGLDWRFVSSIIYQESHFCTDVLGIGGSYGIMQMMPVTYERYGLNDTSTVEDQIRAGVKYISFLYNIFANKVDTNDIYYFVAGAYNSGPGHILDAITLCKKYGGDSEHWESVKEYLLLKSHKDYYSDPDVKCGYYPGKHTVNYVQEVMDRYNGYKLTKKE
ncbi:MAG: transglycosylase SLT domain-containing protein [Bacteroidales bacterium]|nr:transglycosylase SLT domain-containing protein [Bacteroidales bacterium]